MMIDNSSSAVQWRQCWCRLRIAKQTAGRRARWRSTAECGIREPEPAQVSSALLYAAHTGTAQPALADTVPLTCSTRADTLAPCLCAATTDRFSCARNVTTQKYLLSLNKINYLGLQQIVLQSICLTQKLYITLYLKTFFLYIFFKC